VTATTADDQQRAPQRGERPRQQQEVSDRRPGRRQRGTLNCSGAADRRTRHALRPDRLTRRRERGDDLARTARRPRRHIDRRWWSWDRGGRRFGCRWGQALDVGGFAALAMQQHGIEIPFSDIVLQVQGQLQGVDTTLSGASGSQANIRQVTIILSLGIAHSNSGLNRAIGVNQSNALAATVQSDTTNGHAVATNRGLDII
jgi:hypothetical protein